MRCLTFLVLSFALLATPALADEVGAKPADQSVAAPAQPEAAPENAPPATTEPVAVAPAAEPAPAAVPVADSGTEWSLRLGEAVLTPSGKLSLSGGGVVGSNLDMKQQMHLKKDATPYIEGGVDFDRHAFHLSWFETRLHGTSSDPTMLFNFNGKAFFAAPYTFDIALRLIDGSFAYYPLKYDGERFMAQLGGELSVKSVRTTARVADSSPFVQAVKASALFPTVGLRGAISLKHKATVSMRYGYYRMGGNRYSDGEAILDLNPMMFSANPAASQVDLFVGMRGLKLDMSGQNSNQIQLSSTLKGPFFGMRFHY